jgi:hypothetical protein
MKIPQIVEKIESLLAQPGTNYFTVNGENDELIKIRVSNHSCNKQNNGDQKTLSFVSARTQQKQSAYNQIANEWMILENGLTDTYEEIDYILTENGVK